MGKIRIQIYDVIRSSAMIRTAQNDVCHALNGVQKSKAAISSQIRARNNMDARINETTRLLNETVKSMSQIDGIVNKGAISYQNMDSKAVMNARSIMEKYGRLM